MRKKILVWVGIITVLSVVLMAAPVSVKRDYQSWYVIGVTPAVGQSKVFIQGVSYISVVNYGDNPVEVVVCTSENRTSSFSDTDRIIRLEKGVSFDDNVEAESVLYRTTGGTSNIQIYVSY